jgi:hypothetical protein
MNVLGLASEQVGVDGSSQVAALAEVEANC